MVRLQPGRCGHEQETVRWLCLTALTFPLLVSRRLDVLVGLPNQEPTPCSSMLLPVELVCMMGALVCRHHEQVADPAEMPGIHQIDDVCRARQGKPSSRDC